MRKSFSRITPRHRAVTEGSAAHTSRIVVVAASLEGVTRFSRVSSTSTRGLRSSSGTEARRPAPVCVDCGDRPCGNRRPSTIGRVPAAPRSARPSRVLSPPRRRPRPRQQSPHSHVGEPSLSRLRVVVMLPAAHRRVGSFKHFPTRPVAIAAVPRIAVEALPRVAENQVEEDPGVFLGRVQIYYLLPPRSSPTKRLPKMLRLVASIPARPSR